MCEQAEGPGSNPGGGSGWSSSSEGNWTQCLLGKVCLRNPEKIRAEATREAGQRGWVLSSLPAEGEGGGGVGVGGWG